MCLMLGLGCFCQPGHKAHQWFISNWSRAHPLSLPRSISRSNILCLHTDFLHTTDIANAEKIAINNRKIINKDICSCFQSYHYTLRNHCFSNFWYKNIFFSLCCVFLCAYFILFILRAPSFSRFFSKEK